MDDIREMEQGELGSYQGGQRCCRVDGQVSERPRGSELNMRPFLRRAHQSAHTQPCVFCD